MVRTILGTSAPFGIEHKHYVPRIHNHDSKNSCMRNKETIIYTF